MPCPTENIELTPVTHPRPVEATSSDAEERPPPSRPNNIGGEIAHGELTGQGLAPTDRGPAAWRLLVAAFVFEALLWGNALSQLLTKGIGLMQIEPRLPSVVRSLPKLLFSYP